MTTNLWTYNAVDLARTIANKEASAREATLSVLARINDVNPRINAVVDVMADEALLAADEADSRQESGAPLGPLHGVPVTVKVNVDTRGRATTDGIVSAKDNIAATDSPLVASLRAAGAIIVGRSNTPAFSLRWFTDNDLHGRTLNPFDATVTPGGSSGGAAAAVACGMGAMAHGNDYGGSIRYPAWACGVVGLRTTVGRVPSYKASAPNRTITNQLMSVQGPLTRTVADARLALKVMAQGSAFDPQWVDAPLEYADTATRAPNTLRIAMFKRHAGYDADAGVVASVEQAAGWLAKAGYEIEEVEPPHFEEAADLWNQMVMDDMRRGGQGAIELMGDHGTQSALRGYMAGLPQLDQSQTLEAQLRRFSILRDWAIFLARYPLLLMPNSWRLQFRVNADTAGDAAVKQLLAAQSPLLGTAMMGLPGLSVPTGIVNGLPTGVQLVSWKFREDLLLRVGEGIEAAARFSVLAHLPSSPHSSQHIAQELCHAE